MGGLGIRNLESGQTCVACLFHELINVGEMGYTVYTKIGRWRVFNEPITASSNFKKICKVKEMLSCWVHNESYSTKSA